MGRVRVFDRLVSGSRWHLFEWCDLAVTPSFIKHCCQAMLAAQWTHRLPLIQQQCPGELAADLLRQMLDEIEDINRERYTVIDFCSGAGGPTPMIEKSVNLVRAARNNPAILFRLSDLHPHIDAWMEHASRSPHLSFIPQPVDATRAPPSVISKTSSRCPIPESATMMIHLFCLSFHHFSDEQASRVMRSTLESSDGFAIIELQGRTLGEIILMTGEFALLLLLTVFWFPHDWMQLFFTYSLPVLPFVQLWDGLVSCLRTRTFGEVLMMAEKSLGEKAKMIKGITLENSKNTDRQESIVAVCADWKFTNVRRMHTWPFGYMNAIVGQKRMY